jgi:hypothetical protein
MCNVMGTSLLCPDTALAVELRLRLGQMGKQ